MAKPLTPLSKIAPTSEGSRDARDENLVPRWEERFEERFVLDVGRVLFGDPEELEKQGWVVGKGKCIIRQDTDPDDLKAFISQVRQEAIEYTVDRMISEAYRCSFMEYGNDRILVSHGDLVSIGHELKDEVKKGNT